MDGTKPRRALSILPDNAGLAPDINSPGGSPALDRKVRWEVLSTLALPADLVGSYALKRQACTQETQFSIESRILKGMLLTLFGLVTDTNEGKASRKA